VWPRPSPPHHRQIRREQAGHGAHQEGLTIPEDKKMATYPIEAVEILGHGVLKSEGLVVDKENNVYDGGRNTVIYRVSPEGKVSEPCTLPAGSLPNGVTMDRSGNLVYCDLGKQVMMRVTPGGQGSMIADQVHTTFRGNPLYHR
jgi:streptogramin lyase